MNETENFLRAAFAATAEPADSGFVQRVEMRIDAIERRRSVLLASLMAVGAVLLAMLFVGLFRLGPMWVMLAQQNWFALPPVALGLVSIWAPVAGFIGIVGITFPLVWPRT